MSTQQSFSPKHIQFRLSDEALWQRLEDAAVAASRSPNQVAKQLVIDALGSSSEQGLEDAMPDDTSRSSREVSSVSLLQILELLEHIADTQVRVLEVVCQSSGRTDAPDAVALSAEVHQGLLHEIDAVKLSVLEALRVLDGNLVKIYQYIGVGMLMLHHDDLEEASRIIRNQVNQLERVSS